MNIEKKEQDGINIVQLNGDVDLESSPKARKELLDSVGQGKSLVVDLSGINYIDSSGIASLVEAFQTARARGQFFGLASVSASAQRVLQLARLDKVFKIYPDVGAALAAASA